MDNIQLHLERDLDTAIARLLGLVDTTCWRGTQLEAPAGTEWAYAMRFLSAMGRLDVSTDDDRHITGQWADWPESPSGT